MGRTWLTLRRTTVPVYLTPKDIRHFKKELGFNVPFDENSTISGHIDALQIRNGAIHVLDYKPNAIREKPIEQLTFYALALSRRTGLRLYDFKCAWFDEKHYFEFFPLHVVLKKRKQQDLHRTSAFHKNLPTLDSKL